MKLKMAEYSDEIAEKQKVRLSTNQSQTDSLSDATGSEAASINAETASDQAATTLNPAQPANGLAETAASQLDSLPNQLVKENSKESLVGTVIAGHYEILSCLGEGGMSTVYKAKHVLLDSVRAIKILHIARSADGKILQRFQQEAKASFFLSHPNIVRVYDFGIEPTLQQPFLIMDCLEGRPLNKTLESGSLPRERAISIISQVCDALEHAHAKGIVHRDIKPANIMLSHNETGTEVAQLVDFGIAKLISPDEGNDLTQTGEVFGTPLYMSPEQCLGRSVDARSDIYSLGCVLYECLSGKPPFQGASQLETLIMHVQNEADLEDERVPSNLKSIIHRCLAKDPRERYSSVNEFKEDLQALNSARAPIIDHKVGRWLKNIDKRFQNARTSRILMVLILVCVFCSALILTYPGGRQKEKIIVVESKPKIVALPVAKNQSNLPSDLELQLAHAKTAQLKINVLLDWQKSHPDFDYFVENELRHWYGSIDERKSAEHTDTILKNVRMDEYTMNVLSGWNRGKDAAKSARSYLHWSNTYPDLPALSAACYIAAGDQYAQSGNLKKARWCYEQVIASNNKTISGYKSFAKISLDGLAER